MSRPPSIVIKNKQQILDMVEKGIELSEISRRYKITPSAISNQLASDDAYKVSRVIGLETKLDTREQQLESANDSISVSRARELLKLQQWKLERLHSQVYGNQPKVSISINTVPSTELLEDDVHELVKLIPTIGNKVTTDDHTIDKSKSVLPPIIETQDSILPNTDDHNKDKS